MILYALLLAVCSGIAFGYDYGLAEYITFSRDDMKLMVLKRDYYPEILYPGMGRTGDATGGAEEGDQFLRAGGQSPLSGVLPSWLYKTTPGPSSNPPTATRTTQSSTIITRTHTTKKRKIIKVIKVTKKVPLRTITKATKASKASKKSQRISTTNRRNKQTRKSTKAIESAPPSTIKEVKASNKMLNLLENFWETTTDFPTGSTAPTTTTTITTTPTPTTTTPTTTTTTTKTTSPEIESKSPESKTFKTLPISRQTSYSPTSALRIFLHKSDPTKWRPTKPETFFYNTLATNLRRKMKEDSYHPEMEIRIPLFGRHKGLPMRHWHVPTTPSKATENAETDTPVDDNYRNILYF
ncbi:protein let-653-like [Leguminivora glycinivorella]|uniref:protein let-653-like n=1 Tax=Leguminivora glycinivorella TaxID=1035111 RepID=UPI0020106BD4|nr:protein let-653-like [Leguminivora glycinivorella]XP_047991561.1 protein let-653-like [Leguminivora glycinivorella]